MGLAYCLPCAEASPVWSIAAARLGAGRNEPALISYHQNIAKAIGSDRLIPLYEDQDN